MGTERKKKAERRNNMIKVLQGFVEGLQTDIHLESYRATLKKVPNWKTPDHHSIHGFLFKKFTSIHD